MTAFAMGSTVYVHGLQYRTDLNAQGGRVCMEKPRDDGRVGVELLHTKQRIWVRAQNLLRIPDKRGLMTFPMDCGFAPPEYKWAKKHMLDDADRLCECGRVTKECNELCKTCHKSQWSREARKEHAIKQREKRKMRVDMCAERGTRTREADFYEHSWSWHPFTMNIAPPEAFEEGWGE